MLKKFMVLDIEGTYKIKETNKDFLKFCYEEIGCDTIDRVAVAQGLDFWVDDEGMFTQQPNFYASAIAAGLGYVNILYGNVVVSGIDYNRGSTVSIPAKWESTIVNFYKDLEDFSDDLD